MPSAVAPDSSQCAKTPQIEGGVVFKRIIGRTKDEKGQAAVDFAIILPVLLLLLCGIIDFGWIGYSKITLSYCSREGARYGAVHANAEGAQAHIANRVMAAAPEFLHDSLSVTVSFTHPSSPSEGDVSVRVEAVVRGLTPVAGSLFGADGGMLMVSTCVMKVE
jgi:Flp pilus assembly protein TadG